MKTATITTGTMKTKELLKFLANATTTYFQAAEHNKAEMNLIAINDYKRQLWRSNCTIPPTDDLLDKGIFNGEGSK